MIIDVMTTDVAHGGYCVARHEGRVVFVLGALPGERVEAEITERRAKMWYARVVDVLEPSPDRIPHVWPLAERTGIGGADLGHVSLEAGRRWKARVIDTQMSRIAHIPTSVVVEPAPGDESRHGLSWRTRVTFQVDSSGRLGMYGAKSHTIYPVDGMPLAHEDIQAELRADIESGVPGLAGGTRTYVCPSASPLVVADHLPRSRRASAGVDRTSRTRNSQRGPVQGSVAAGASSTTCPVSETVSEVVRTPQGEWTYEVAADGFWQVHREAPGVLVAAVVDAVGHPDAPILDLYSGSGLFTQPLCDLGPVTAVESSPIAVASCRTNTEGRDVRCLEGDVPTVLADLHPMGAGVVVCDPPRSGAGARTVTQIARLDPDRVVYVACDPAALARDVALFAAHGYSLDCLRAFDLFPMTHHVECLATLTKNS